MTEPKEQIEIVRKTVVVFDISSSTTILEELKRCDRLNVWRNTFINMKGVLQTITGAEPYKFMGDGWILFFPFDVEMETLMAGINEVATFYYFMFQHIIEPLIPEKPKPLGLTIGIESGELIRFQMNENWEYIGRPINVAARLQSKAKDFASGDFTNVALISRPTFNSLLPKQNTFTKSAVEHTVNLKNISGGENFRCFLLPLVT